MSDANRTIAYRIVSDMLDDPDASGIYPTTKCYDALEAALDAKDAELAAALASEQMACVQRQNERRRADKAGDEVKRIIISAANKAASDISGMDESLDYDTALKLLGQLIEKGLNEGKAETELAVAQAALLEARDVMRYMMDHQGHHLANHQAVIDAAKGEK